MSAQTRILVFDSGVGALSIIEHLRRRLPSLAIDFLSDDAFFPYGEKSDIELIERVDKVIRRQWQTEGFDMMVVACNTASTVCLPSLRSFLPVPVVGVVPAIKPAVKQSLSRSIGLLATPATVARSYTHQLVRDYAVDCRVYMHGSSHLVHQAEKKIRGETLDTELIRAELHTLLSKGDKIDQVVLGCTHFPLLLPELTEALQGVEVSFVDSGAAISARVESLLAIEDTTLAGGLRKFLTSNFERI